MKITKEDVEKMAKLAKLHFSDDEKERFRGHLEQILEYVERLNELDTDQVEPTYYIQNSQDPLREDRVELSLPREEALKNAPAHIHGFFRVPKVIPSS